MPAAPPSPPLSPPPPPSPTPPTRTRRKASRSNRTDCVHNLPPHAQEEPKRHPPKATSATATNSGIYVATFQTAPSEPKNGIMHDRARQQHHRCLGAIATSETQPESAMAEAAVPEKQACDSSKSVVPSAAGRPQQSRRHGRIGQLSEPLAYSPLRPDTDRFVDARTPDRDSPNVHISPYSQ